MAQMIIDVPTEGRPSEPITADALVGIDGNAFSIIGHTAKLLRRGGASAEFVASFQREAMSGDYNHVIQTAMAYLDPGDEDE